MWLILLIRAPDIYSNLNIKFLARLVPDAVDMNQNQSKSSSDRIYRIYRIRTVAFMKSPAARSPCPHGRPRGTSAVTRRESIESMGAEVSAKKEPWQSETADVKSHCGANNCHKKHSYFANFAVKSAAYL